MCLLGQCLHPDVVADFVGTFLSGSATFRNGSRRTSLRLRSPIPFGAAFAFLPTCLGTFLPFRSASTCCHAARLSCSSAHGRGARHERVLLLQPGPPTRPGTWGMGCHGRISRAVRRAADLPRGAAHAASALRGTTGARPSPPRPSAWAPPRANPRWQTPPRPDAAARPVGSRSVADFASLPARVPRSRRPW